MTSKQTFKAGYCVPTERLHEVGVDSFCAKFRLRHNLRRTFLSQWMRKDGEHGDIGMNEGVSLGLMLFNHISGQGYSKVYHMYSATFEFFKNSKLVLSYKVSHRTHQIEETIHYGGMK